MKKRYIYRLFKLPALIVVIILVMNGFSFKSIVQELYSPRIIDLSMYSDSLKKVQSVEVYLPPVYSNEKPYPVLYLLHGKDGRTNSWFNGFYGINGAKINQTADRLIKKNSIKPMILVSPQIDNSYGVNTSAQTSHYQDHDEGLYEDFLIKELIRNFILEVLFVLLQVFFQLTDKDGVTHEPNAKPYEFDEAAVYALLNSKEILYPITSRIDGNGKKTIRKLATIENTVLI